MKNLQFTVTINAPKEKVWKVLWDDKTYRSWTNAFSEGSYAVSDWKEGSKIQFLSSKDDGMYSEIARLIPNEFMSFRYLGEVKDGKEIPRTEETNQWSGAMENYTLQETEGHTKLIVDLTGPEKFQDFISEAFPKALDKVKEISEEKE